MKGGESQGCVETVQRQESFDSATQASGVLRRTLGMPPYTVVLYGHVAHYAPQHKQLISYRL
jgi:hypothetical protein